MTVSIPISADASAVQRAMHDIQTAIERTNQVGKVLKRGHLLITKVSPARPRGGQVEA